MPQDWILHVINRGVYVIWVLETAEYNFDSSSVILEEV